MQLNKKTIYIIIGAAGFFLLFLVLAFMVLSRQAAAPQSGGIANVTPVPSLTPFREVTIIPSVVPKSALKVPTYAPSEGRGVDIESPTVQTSMAEIEKLLPQLPLEKPLPSVEGPFPVVLNISAPSVVYPEWILNVYFDGINFLEPENSPYYAQTRTAFKHAANETYLWIQQQGADPTKIIILWGDTDATQAIAEEWLK